MPSVGVKLYSVFFKLFLKHKLQNHALTTEHEGHGITSRPLSGTVPANPAFVDGIAAKDIHIDHRTNLSVRIFLPESSLPRERIGSGSPSGLLGLHKKDSELSNDFRTRELEANKPSRSTGYGVMTDNGALQGRHRSRMGTGGPENESLLENGEAKVEHDKVDKADTGKEKIPESGNYRGYLPKVSDHLHRRLPIIIQFHGGGFVTGSKDSLPNDLFCRRLAKLCDAIVIAVGYRLAPEHKFPAAFEDAVEAVKWLAKQANLADCNRSLLYHPTSYFPNGSDSYRGEGHREIVDTFGSSVVEPWLAAHGDPSRCVLLGVSSGANIADYVARKAVKIARTLDPVKIVAQVLMYPFFIGSIPTHSEIKLANSYFFDKATCILAWKLFLPEGEFNLDHVAANPLVPGREPPLKLMPPTLTVVAELDWMKDRAIAYSEALRKVNIDAPVLEYKDAVHEFATLDILIKSKQAEACAEDIAIWVKKYISLKGHEFSY
eukprot:TRINITY_DN27196_c0_g1_i1.p1 TRINITY_DN27196_c0_g1~~TRINITY_DN27196_c0_g1_i1.p1  ORF type:complete len:491 (-),score=87.34 TRINITY_DN27196_c0_g1_i1:255-1727(-)